MPEAQYGILYDESTDISMALNVEVNLTGK